MKVELKYIVDGFRSLQGLLSLPLTMSKAKELSKIIDITEKEFNQFQKVRDAGIKRLGIERVQGSGEFYILPGTPNFEKFNTELEELRNQKVDLGDYALITITEEEYTGLKLSAYDYRSVSKFVIFDFPNGKSTASPSKLEQSASIEPAKVIEEVKQLDSN